MMTKFKLLILFFALSLSAHAKDFFKAKLIYNNGKFLNCYASFFENPYQKEIIYKLELKSKTQEIKSIELKKIVFYENSDSVEFELITTYRILSSKPDDPCWMVRLIKGNCKLYYAFTEGYSHFSGINEFGAMKFNSKLDSYMLACIRPNEPYATIMAVYQKGGLVINANTGFRKAGSEYFSDYPELASKISSKEYNYKDVVKVVEIYNDWKSKK
jgi:hypothetical protein